MPRWLSPLLVCLALACGEPVFADAVPKSDAAIRSAAPARRTIATLPTCNTDAEGRSFLAIDAADATTCSVGGGSNRHVCTCQQGAYIAENPVASGTGDQLGADQDRGAFTVAGGGTTASLNANVVGSAQVTDGSLTGADVQDNSLGSADVAGLDASTDITTGTLPDARVSLSSVKQHEAGLTVENLGTACPAGQIPKSDGAGGVNCSADSTGGTPTFDTVASGTNTTATMQIGTGASLAPAGSGTITANAYTGGALTDAQVSGANESDEVTIGGDASGTAANLQLGAGVVGDVEAAAILSRDTEAPAAGDITGSLSAGYQIAADAVGAPEIAAGAVGASEAANLDAGDTTTGTFDAARIPALSALSGTVTDVQVPNNITIDAATEGRRLDDNGAGEVSIRYNATYNLWYEDRDDDGVMDDGEGFIQERDHVGNVYACDPSSYDQTVVSGAAPSVEGIRQCYAALPAGGGTIRLTHGNWFITDGTPITFNTNGKKVRLVGAGKGSVIWCGAAFGCTAPAMLRIHASDVTIENLSFKSDTGVNAIETGGGGGTGEYPSGILIRDIYLEGKSGDNGTLDKDGTHTGAANAATLTDSGATFTSSNVGRVVRNVTDGSECTVTSQTSTTLTCTLAGGTDNDWDVGDAYYLKRRGYGIYVKGLENRFENIQAVTWEACMYFDRSTSGGANENLVDRLDCLQADFGIDHGVGDASVNKIQNSIFQTIYLYGIVSRGNTVDNGGDGAWELYRNYFETMDTGIMSIGGSTGQDPDIIVTGSLAGVYSGDVLGDADTLSDGIVMDAATDADIYATDVRLTNVSCITHAGTGNLYLNGVRAPNGMGLTCTPTTDGTTPLSASRLRDYTADLAWRDEATVVTGDWDFSGAPLTTADIDEATLDDDLLPFDDADNLFTANALGPALEELNDSINAGVPNGAGAKLHWSQLLGVPAGFADGTDDGAGGGSSAALDLADDGTNESAGLTEIATLGDNAGADAVFSEPSADKLLIQLGKKWPGGTLALYRSASAILPWLSHDAASTASLDLEVNGAVDWTFTPGVLRAANGDQLLEWEGVTADANENTLGSADPIGDARFNLPGLATGTYVLATREAAETFSGVKTFSVAPNLAASSIDAITEIASSIRIGNGAKLLTGTEGTDLVTVETPSSANTIRWLVTNPGAGGVAFESEPHSTDGGTLRAIEGQDDGTNFFGFKVPNSGLAIDRECTVEDDANPIPDACVGDGVDDDVPEASDYTALTAGNGLTSSVTGTIDAAVGLGLRLAGDAIALDPTAALSGDHALSAGEAKFGANGLIFEGSVADAFETYVVVTNPTAERSFTIPDATSVAVVPTTCGSTDKVSAINTNGTVTCSPDQTGAGGGESVRVEDGDNAGTYTDATDVDLSDQGDINFVLDAGTSPDQVTAEIRAGVVGTPELADDGVTYAKLQNVSATARVLGRATAGAGDAEELTASQVLGFIGATQGQTLYRDASAWVALSPGTAGQVLQTGGAAANPSWRSIPRYLDFLAAGCNASAAGPGWNIPTANGPTAACGGAAPDSTGYLEYPDGANAITAEFFFTLRDWDGGAIAFDLDWACTSAAGCSTNSVVWNIATACVAVDENFDNPTFNAAQSITTAASATRYAKKRSSQASLTTTGCAAGETLKVQVQRDPTNGSDTLAASAGAITASIEYGTL